MKIIFKTALFIATVIVGIAGFIAFFGEHESLTATILSKPVGIILILASFRAYKRLSPDTQYKTH